jgi:hypothetical protein
MHGSSAMQRLGLIARIALCALCGVGVLHGAASNAPAISATEITSPAAPRSMGAALINAPDGTLWLSWVEPGRAGANTLRCSSFNPAEQKWAAPRTVASGPTVSTNPLDFPQLVFDGRGGAFAVWTDAHGGAFLSRSADTAATWSAPVPFTSDGHEVEKFSFVALADGRVLAAWLDGRARQAGGKMQQLFARVLGAEGPDWLVDPSVCDCCPTALTAFPDGGALVAYRGRTSDEVRDIRVARFRGGAWDEPHALNHDDWHINGCPVNGPRLASDGGRVAVAWFTAAANEPRALASFSPDAGARFLMPLSVDLGKPAGNVDVLLLHDTTILVTWLEADGSFWLRRISPDFSVEQKPFALVAPGTAHVKGIPRLALVRDYAGGKTSARFMAAFVRDGAGGGVRTLLVTVPEGDLLAAEKDCGCTPTAEQLQGFSIRGTVLAANPRRASVRVHHEELPGVFSAGDRDFKVAPELLLTVPAGRQFLGRVERRDGIWWLYDVRLIATSPADR